jgi:type I restriction enzyme, S subunit
MAGESKKVILGDLIHVKHGYAFQGEFFRDEPPGDILLTPGNFAIGGGFKGDKLKYYDGVAPDEFVLGEGDLLISMTDLSKTADTLGYPALVPSASDGHKFLHNQRLGKVLVKSPEIVDQGFLYYLLCSREYRNEIIAGATGTTVKHTSPSRISAFRFQLPPLVVQCAIARVLGALDKKIELNRRMNETLEATARALFKSWFVDFDPVRAKSEGRDPELPKPIIDLLPASFDESELGKVPMGWTVYALDEIATFLNGIALQKYPANGERFLPVIKIAQLRSGSTERADRARDDIPIAYVIADGDILFSWSGSLECILWAGGPGALNQHLFKVTSGKYPRWLCYLGIQIHLDEFRHIAAGKATTMGHIQRHHLSNAKLALPAPELLARMSVYFEPLIESLWRHNVQSRTLTTLRDALLPKLIAGEIRLKDAEKIVGVAI